MIHFSYISQIHLSHSFISIPAIELLCITIELQDIPNKSKTQSAAKFSNCSTFHATASKRKMNVLPVLLLLLMQQLTAVPLAQADQIAVETPASSSATKLSMVSPNNSTNNATTLNEAKSANASSSGMSIRVLIYTIYILLIYIRKCLP